MFESLPTGVVLGAVGLGLLHGAEPGHGWPVAATYALEKPNKWLSGFAASFVLGVGHLVSSLAVVAAFFLVKSSVGVESAWWLDYLAGGLLILLGVHEFRSGHSHDHADGHDHSHDHADGHDHSHRIGQVEDRHRFPERGQSHREHEPADTTHHEHCEGPHAHGDGDGVLARIGALLPFGGGGHSHDDESLAEAADRGLWSIAGTAFVLGFAHEEEFEIIGLCAGSSLCLELMTAYALAVVVGIVALTLLLVAGYERYEDRVTRWADHFPTISAAVLVLMGVGFLTGVL
jgi:nickel/cobalt exporter